MSGYAGFNVERLCAAAERLRGAGHVVLCAAEQQPDDALPYDPAGSWPLLMKRAIALMLRCDAVCLLGGWEVSAGATREKAVADVCGIPCYDERGAPLGPGRGPTDASAGKAPWGLVPLDAMSGVPAVFADGNARHGRDGWRFGVAWTHYVGKIMRHLVAWRAGEDLDGGHHHLDRLVANALILRWLTVHRVDLDDRVLVPGWRMADGGTP
jgi:hypothetical protein